jgi:hypothetical protein
MRKLRMFIRRQRAKIAVAFVLILLALGVVLGARGLYHQRSAPQQLVWKKPPSNEDDNLKDPRPLKDKAKEAGRYVAAEYPPKFDKLNTLGELAREADAVVIAKALHNTSQLSPNGKTVTIVYEMSVLHVYKGTFGTGNDLSVSLPGGLARFSDGTSAEVRTPWFKKMLNGGTYLLFLSRQPDRAWTPTGGPRGLFEIPTNEANRKVASHTMIDGDPMRAYDGMEVTQFLRALKEALTRGKQQ